MKETKFRRLRLDELNQVRDQFVKWLALNGYSADHWEKTKTEYPARADEMILQFSHIVFSGVIEKVEFLVHRRPNDLRVYRTDPDKIYMRGVLLDGDTSVDFTDGSLSPQEMFDRLKHENVKPRMYSAERNYLPVGRDQDIFILMEGGALIDSGELFRTLESL